MTVSRRDLEHATRERFIWGAATFCDVEGCDRPGAACDNEAENPESGRGPDVCFMHVCERIGLIDPFPARTSVPRELTGQQSCDFRGCDEPGYLVCSIAEMTIVIETGRGGGHEGQWVLCRGHAHARPRHVSDENGFWRLELVPPGDPEETL